MILSSCSYAVGYALTTADISRFSAVYQPLGIRFVNAENIEQLEDCLRRVRYLVALHISAEHTDVVSAIAGEKAYWIDAGTTSIEDRAVSALGRMIPDGFDELVVNASNHLLPSLLPGVQASFSRDNTGPIDYDFVIQCDTTALPYVGRALLLCDTKKLIAIDPTLSTLSRRLLLDGLREFVNQFLGLIHQNLVKIGHKCRVGLPSVFHREDAGALFDSGLYLPYVSASDSCGIMQVRCGLVNSQGGQKLDLHGLVSVGEQGDVDFL